MRKDVASCLFLGTNHLSSRVLFLPRLPCSMSLPIITNNQLYKIYIGNEKKNLDDLYGWTRITITLICIIYLRKKKYLRTFTSYHLIIIDIISLNKRRWTTTKTRRSNEWQMCKKREKKRRDFSFWL